ncbi:MAG: peptidylprolyl isomerase [Syntrophaceae bacterium]|nr:peptidylprolyl isomerase [Syntrophaceae bacterium]NTW77496.1 peptidylprolyl isomerase [Syntrophaceae bacterium]
MVKAKKGDKVKVHYTGRFEGGDIFDSSECDEHGCDCNVEPLEFTIGKGEVIPGFEKAVIGMKAGEEKTLTIPAKDAYGKRKDEMVVTIDRSDVPEDIIPEVGMRLEVAQDDDQVFPVTITEVSETHVTLDANHPLAGIDLTFDLRLVEIC